MKRPQRMPAQDRRLAHGKRAVTPGRSGRLWLYGRHAVLAALANPARRCRRLLATERALAAQPLPDAAGLDPDVCAEADLVRLVGADVPHQGLLLEVDPLPDIAIDDVLDGARGRPLVMLDQVTDPQNVGAILRSAAAFDAAAVISQDRHSPPETGALAKAASGALEIMPWCRVVNLSRALEAITQAGYWRIGLTGHAQTVLADAVSRDPVCLVLGAEGAGLRPNVADHCDVLARLPIAAGVESLNVSTAAAVSLYAVRMAQRP